MTFIKACNITIPIATRNQKVFLVLKNKLKNRAAELINSRNQSSWDSIKYLLDSQFGDSRTLTSQMQDLQTTKQLNNENPLTFILRLQTHESKITSNNKQNLTQEQ